MRYLKTNTATRVTVGPFLDKTDGITPETALTVTGIKLTFVVDDGGVPTLVLDTNPTASGGNNDMVHITGDDAGFYDLELTAANVNYVGRAMLALTDAANHCPVFHEFMILPAVIYDSMVNGTDLFDVSVTQLAGSAIDQSGGLINANVKQISTDATAADNAEAFFDGTGYAGTGNVIPTVTTLTNAPSDSSGVTTLLSRLSAARAGYLDNLSAGAVATLAKLQGYVRLLARKDAAVATDHATELTEINANGGSGAGAYANTTDSQEALRDNTGTAGAGLSAVPWNAAWDAEVESEATDALNAYDPPTKAELDAGLASADDATLAAIAALNNLSQANIRSAVGLASANLDTQLAAILADTNAILADTGTDGVVVAAGSKTGYRLSATGVDDVLDEVVEGAYTMRQFLRLFAAALLGKVTGAATNAPVFRDTGDTTNRISATTDGDGNRSAVTLDAS